VTTHVSGNENGQAGERKGSGLRRRGADVAKAASGLQGRGHKVQRELEDLRNRVDQLEQDIQEARQMNKRLAEITDVVAEVLLPAEQRDEERMRELLARYEQSLTS
jgi:predicted  nucleic acid-binding Zn-ribbon protein